MQPTATDLDLIDALTVPAGLERRVEERYSCYWPARCVAGDGASFDGVVVDASKGGFCVASRQAVEIGERITLGLDQIGAFECDVRWTARDRFGVRIVEVRGQLSGEQVDELALSLDRLVDQDTDDEERADVPPRRSFRYF